MTTDLTPVAVAHGHNNPVAVDYHAIVYGLENALRTIAIDPAFVMPARKQLLLDLLAIVPAAERMLLVGRLMTLGVCYRNAWEVGAEPNATALHNELAEVAMATAELVVRESAQAVARYAAVALAVA